jgi:hypothetical protein
MSDEKNYEVLYKLEKLKNKIYREIIEKNTNIVLGDILVENEEGLHVYLYNGLNNIPVFIHEYLNEDSSTDIGKVVSNTLKKSKSKHKFRPFKNAINTQDRTIDEDKIKAIENTIISEKEIFGNTDDIVPQFNILFDKLRTSRIYNGIIDDIKSLRLKLIGTIKLSEYIDLLKSHVTLFTDIFKEKQYLERKIIQIINKGLSPLEGRIIFYGNYINTTIEIDEMQKFDKSLSIGINFPKSYEPFNKITFIQQFQNYSSVLFPIKTNIERYLFNRYGFYNVIYFQAPKSTDDDPYSFYIIDKIDKGKICWIMDTRLEDLSNYIIANVKPYLISTFRRIYKDIFNDNEYRSDYMYKSAITSTDCEQILQNIFTLNNNKIFCRELRAIVKNRATHVATTNDKFNIYGDDLMQKKRLSSNKEEFDIVYTIKLIFDGITSEQAVDFYRNRT